MSDLLVIAPFCKSVAKTERLKKTMKAGLTEVKYEVVETVNEFEKTSLRNRKILFFISLGESGINLEFYNILKKIRLDVNCLIGSVAGIIVDGSSDLFTKSVSRDLVFAANRAGCTFPGRPLVEGTGTLENFNIIAKNMATDNFTAYVESCKELIKRVIAFEKPIIKKPKLLMLHTSNVKTSNTLTLWNKAKESLDCQIKEISLRDGEIHDCRGCPYEACLHLGEKNKCFYGGVITKEVYPAIMECDALVMVCANYNDSVSANLTAFINRLTAIFRVHRFYEKRLYAVIVSGYSGGDIVASQVISALNMNKTFMLPPKFALLETANDPKAILNNKKALENATSFGKAIMEEFTSCQNPQK